MDADFWNARYGDSAYLYGEEPNGFVRSVAKRIPPGRVLCLAEGEGRNAVHLARLGYQVTAMDQSKRGLEKARVLAEKHGVSLQTVAADLAVYELEPNAWSGIIATFAHVPPAVRAKMHEQVVLGLKPGGVYALEAYTPAQLAFDTGGPKDPALLMTLEQLKKELSGLDFLIGQEIERQVVEGHGHSGRAAVVQILAQRR